jgi:ribosomal protein L17
MRGNVETMEQKAKALRNLFDHPIEKAVYRSTKRQRMRPATIPAARAQARGLAALMKK